MTFILIFSFLIITCLYLAFLIYKQNPKGRDNKSFLWLVIGLSIWLILNYLENQPFSEQTRILFFKGDYFIALIWGYFWFLFCFNFLENKKLPIFINITLIAFLFLMEYLLIYDKIIFNIRAIEPIIKYDFGLLYYIYSFFIFFLFVGGSIAIYLKHKKFKGEKKLQALNVLYGFLITSTIVTIINLFFQDKLSIDLYRLANCSFVFFVYFTYRSITKHHLFDIRKTIQRGLTYSFLLSFIIILYLITIFLTSFLFSASTSLTYFYGAALTTVIGVFGVPSIKKYFTKITDKIFYKNKYNYSKAIESLSEILNHNITLEELLKKSTTKLKEYLKPSFLYIYLTEKNVVYDNFHFRPSFKTITIDMIKLIDQESKTVLHSNNIPYLKEQCSNSAKKSLSNLSKIESCTKKHKIMLLIPLKNDKKIIGLMMLGEKLSGDLYNSEDEQLLKTFSNQAAVAFEKARYYEKIKNYSKDLKTQVTERTKEINELQETQKRMMIDVSHNLQTPLTVIKAQLTELEQELPNNDDIFTFEKSIDKLSAFIYNLLKLSRMETGKIVAEKTFFSLSNALEEMVEYYDIIVQDKKITIEHSIKKNISITADRQKIEELISNIVSNSIKYIDKGSKIKINLNKKNEKIIISIKDDGMGIHKKDLKRIFERFYRIKSKKNSQVKGSGLGLAFCKKITELHNGSIDIKSQFGKGAEFIITLPIK